jgi:putative CocE/NonD family hydrolase
MTTGRTTLLTVTAFLLSSLLLFGAEGPTLGVQIERNVPVKMRDGVVLRADVHRPDRGGPYPVLVRRTPYGKGRNFDRYVKAGYIVVSQDARGRFASDGKWESFYRFETHEAEDGYDTVEWAARLPGSTGKVGTFGLSYDALLQWRLAALRPPSLVAMAARSVNPYTREASGSIRPGRRLPWWIRQMSPDMHRRSKRTLPESYKKWVAGGQENWLYFLPWLELPDEAFGHEADAVKYWLRNPHTDPRKLDMCCKEVAVPNFDVVGWHDHANGDMLMFRTLVTEGKTETARKGSRIIIGPWSHFPQGRRRYGKIDHGPEAAIDITALNIRWFNHWIKGKSNGVDADAPVKVFIMGDNRWRDEQRWPLRRTKDKILFTTSAGNANTPGGDGKLLWQKPECSDTDQYVYDPKDPVPTLHARFTHATDQRPLANRRDILVYQTEPLDQRIEVTGNPTVELFAASSAPDTDWIVRLIDVAPGGLARDVSMGLVRARYRHGLDKPELITPGEVVKYTIRMNATSNAFLPGHRIRLDITSSDFPNYDRNHNTAADQNADAQLKTARQTIHHGKARPTRIILPWVSNSAAAAPLEVSTASRR